MDSHMLPRIILACLILASLPLHAAPREWKSANGSRSIFGEFVKRDATSVTIRRADQKEVTIPFHQLHPEERFWTDANHPIAKTGIDISKNKNTVFDELCFGDNRDQVLEKLKASELVELTVAETFIGRTGLNDVFRTRKKIGGLTASLSFDWTEDGGLQEITLKTPEVPAGKFDEQLKPCWQEFIKLLTTLHGQPVTSSPGINLASVPDGGMLPTHLWKLQGTGNAMLGASRDGGHYHVVVRFTRKDVQTFEITVPGIR